MATLPLPDQRAAGLGVLATLLLAVPPDAARVMVLIAACPVGANVAAVVQADGKDPSLSNSATFLSTLACMVTIAFWLSVL